MPFPEMTGRGLLAPAPGGKALVESDELSGPHCVLRIKDSFDEQVETVLQPAEVETLLLLLGENGIGTEAYPPWPLTGRSVSAVLILDKGRLGTSSKGLEFRDNEREDRKERGLRKCKQGANPGFPSSIPPVMAVCG